MKLVVFGPSFCGSTAFSGALQNIPSTIAIGEAHWVIDAPRELGRTARCTICKDSCPMVDPLIQNPPTDANLYDEILRQSGKKRLVTTDKSPYFTKRFCAHRGFIGILLFKSPEAMVASSNRHPVGWKEKHGSALNLYHSFYEGLITYLNQDALKWFAVESEIFFRNPEDELQVICDHLSLPRPKEFQFPPQDWHNIGGNPAYKNTHFNNKLQPDLRWKTELTGKEQRECGRHANSRKTWRKMQHHCLDHKTT